MICAGDTDGIFQLESGGMRNFLVNMRPRTFEDIIAGISLYRPGPMDSIPRYIAGKHDPSTVKYATEKLRPILDVTYGCMVYQEQVMQIVRDLAGYSLGRSDLMRRAMAKKKKDVMMKEREYFIFGMKDEKGNQLIPGCVNNGVSEKVAAQIYDEMSAFASYAFNKSHAAAYGVVAVQTGWLKRHHPVPFMAALMNSVYGNSSKIASYIQYCRSHDIPILPPRVNHSYWRFTVDRDEKGKLGIRFGLGAVKNVGQAAIDAVVKARRQAPFKDIFDFCQRVDPETINKRVVESLIMAGAFDGMGGNRAQYLAMYDIALDGAAARKKQNIDGQVSLFDLDGMGLAPPANPQLPNLTEHPLKARLAMEKEMTGVYITGHPLDEYAALLSQLDCSTAFVQELSERPDRGLSHDGMTVEMGGILVEAKGKATKKGAFMGFITLEDLTGQIEGLVFPKVYEKYQGLLNADDLVVLTGKLSVREDEDTKLLVDKVTPLSQWQPKEKRPLGQPQVKVEKPAAPSPREASVKLYLRLERDMMEKVKPILALTPGPCPVYFHLPQENMTLLAPQVLWVSKLSDLTQRLISELGEANVKWVSKGG
ncbi:MAG: DNA polymerase III subunit alpha, partial [Clostridia bacterium]|nr:DNA polymerase III subunit alpha [Clostridia bacterium]